VGILGPEDRVELIEGEIIEMSPIGDRHGGCVNRANELFVLSFHGKAITTIQNPVRLNMYNEPQPDLVLAKPRSDYYSTGHPRSEDVFLVLEVSDTTLRKDRDIKVPIYAKLGIREVWIEDLQHDQILVFRDLSGKQYKTRRILQRGDTVSTLAFPETIFKVDDLLL
jgi:Uma2 family endonuclease